MGAVRHFGITQGHAEASLPTRFGGFRISVHRVGDTEVTALRRGEVSGDEAVLVRLHSECLTGDALGSLRCDCGIQLDAALDLIGRSGRGVLLYLRHEGRGIGLFNKVRAYSLQDRGLDTVDANLALGLPIDARDYSAAAIVLRALGIRAVRLITNNPAKIAALRTRGVAVTERVPLETLPNPMNADYLRAKAERLGHLLELVGGRVDAPLPVPALRPVVTVHYAQTLDGRIASRTGDARWVSGEQSLRLAHELRAANDAVLVGIGTVLADDPRLTVRLAEGSSPIRVVVDSRLRTPLSANVLAPIPPGTLIATTPRALESAAEALRASGAEVLRARATNDGRVDLGDLLGRLRDRGVRSVLIEGGRAIITSTLREGLVDRLTVCIAPKVIGEGIAAIGDLNIERLREAVIFRNARFVACGEDVVFYGEPAQARASA